MLIMLRLATHTYDVPAFSIPAFSAVSPAATDEPIEVPFDGSCAKHLTVEFYTVVYAANSHTYNY